uniref:WDHD1 first WD40 domain-containing protein n=1 Tax=Timema poppense TaxID=170557 RepID=A0A7R9CWU1_TIMPO|nr:unnamed protein product [Timema poppensis]
MYKERSAFSSRKQRAGESYAAFILSLLHLATTCSFGTFLNDALKSQFYHNISSDMVRDNIRNEEGNFRSMVALANRYEIPGPANVPANASTNPNLIYVVRPNQQNNKKLTKKLHSSQGLKPQLLSGPNHQPSQNAFCAGCGGPHARPNCPFKNAQCHNCHFRGNIAKVCRRVKNYSQHQGGVRQIQENIPSVSVQATTACDLYVVNSSRGQSATLPLVMVRGSFPSLLGISWISHIHLDWNAIFPINYVWQVKGDAVGLLRNKYPPVFKEVPDDIKNVEVNVVLKEGAITVFYGPRVIPIPLKNAVKSPLRKWNQLLIAPSQHLQLRSPTRIPLQWPFVKLPQCDGSYSHPCETCCSVSESVCPTNSLVKLIAWDSPSNNSLCTYLITGGNDGDIRLWMGLEDDDPTSHCVGERALAVKQMGKRLFVGTDNNTVQAYTFPEVEPDGIITRFGAPVTHISVSKDGNTIAAASEDMEVHIYDVALQKSTVIASHTGPVFGVELDPKLEFVASCSGDGTVRVWNLSLNKLGHSWKCVPICNSFLLTKVLGRPSWLPSTGQLLAVPNGKQVCLYKRETWEQITTLTNAQVEKRTHEKKPKKLLGEEVHY